MIKKLLLLIAIIPSLLSAQHIIKGKFSPAEQFKFAFLYRVTAETSEFVDNADLKEDGSFSFKLDEKQVPGTYRIVYAQPQEQYNFDILYNNEDVDLTFDLEKGLEFVTSEDNKLWMSYNNSMRMIGQSLNNFYSQKNGKEKDFNKIITVLKNTQKEFEKAAEGKLVLNFILASNPYIPSKFEDAVTFTKNSKKVYFNHINFGNPVLQNSNFLIEATLSYVFNYHDPNNEMESFKANIDTAIKAIGNNLKVKKILLEILWNQFADEEVELVANHITDNYLLSIAKQEKDQKLVDNLTYFKNASVGNIAPDFTVKIPSKDNKVELKKLSELDTSENYLVFFWSTTCSHCLEETPQLKKLVQNTTKDHLQVIAIALDEDIYRWKDMTYDYPDFIHVFGEGKWDNPISNNYNVKATPSYFVLNKDKKIIQKPYDFEAFSEYFKTLTVKKKEVEKTEKKED